MSFEHLYLDFVLAAGLLALLLWFLERRLNREH